MLIGVNELAELISEAVSLGDGKTGSPGSVIFLFISVFLHWREKFKIFSRFLSDSQKLKTEHRKSALFSTTIWPAGKLSRFCFRRTHS